MKLVRVGTPVRNIKIGDRFISKVSRFTNDTPHIPGLAPGKTFYCRVLSIRKTRWYFYFTVIAETTDLKRTGIKSESTYKQHENALVLREK